MRSIFLTKNPLRYPSKCLGRSLKYIYLVSSLFAKYTLSSLCFWKKTSSWFSFTSLVMLSVFHDASLLYLLLITFHNPLLLWGLGVCFSSSTEICSWKTCGYGQRSLRELLTIFYLDYFNRLLLLLPAFPSDSYCYLPKASICSFHPLIKSLFCLSISNIVKSKFLSTAIRMFHSLVTVYLSSIFSWQFLGLLPTPRIWHISVCVSSFTLALIAALNALPTFSSQHPFPYSYFLHESWLILCINFCS